MNEIELRKEQLEREYFHLQKIIEDYDGKSLTIKAWSVSVVSAIAGSAAIASNFDVLLFAAGASFMFWFIDAYWKSFQQAFFPRIEELESLFEKQSFDKPPFQIKNYWDKSHKKDRNKNFFKVLVWPHIFLPHGAMCIFLVILFSILK